MKARTNEMINRALIVTGRFGFMPREVFWKHISRFGRSENYINWTRLKASGLFKPYPGQDGFLHLSRAGIHALQNQDQIYVGRSNPIYFVHDQLVMSVALACENLNLIKSGWACDAVLRSLSNVELVKIFGGSADKIPDLIFDLKDCGNQTRIALEIERSRKSGAKYDALVLSYMDMRSVNLVIIAYTDAYIERQIRHSMKRLGYPQSQRPIALCKVSDLIETPSVFPISVNGNVIGFDRLVSNLRKLEAEQSRNCPDKIKELNPQLSPESGAA